MKPAKLTMRIPGLKRSVGLGDVVKKATTKVGIRPCGGCNRRAAVLNGRIVFAPRKPKAR
jgi:hypothetical protein